MGGRGKKELTGRAAAEETLEARICRETYNKETKKSKGSTSEPSSSVEQIDEDETVEFPTPVGPVFISIAFFNEAYAGSGADMVTNVAGRTSLTDGTSAAPKRPARRGTYWAPIGGDAEKSSKSVTLKWLSKARNSMGDQLADPADPRSSFSDKPSSKTRLKSIWGSKAERGASIDLSAGDEAVEIVDAEFQSKVSGPALKRVSVARMQEERAAAEYRLQAMWRIHMRNAPGLEAEVAKLHASETAKQILREWEQEQETLRAQQRAAKEAEALKRQMLGGRPSVASAASSSGADGDGAAERGSLPGSSDGSLSRLGSASSSRASGDAAQAPAPLPLEAMSSNDRPPSDGGTDRTSASTNRTNASSPGVMAPLSRFSLTREPSHGLSA